MWDKVTALAAIASLIVSVVALAVAIVGTRSSTRISSEALETARQANDIALGKIREPNVVEYVQNDERKFVFDFITARPLTEELKHIVTVKNVGKTNVEGLSIEVIGIVPFTVLASDPTKEIRPLPATNLRISFRSALLPQGAAHIDVRKLLLQYLTKLEPQLPEKNAIYSTEVNVVLTPKAVNEPLPSGAPIHLNSRDRRMLTVTFVPSVVHTEEAKRVLAEAEVPHRVYEP